MRSTSRTLYAITTRVIAAVEVDSDFDYSLWNSCSVPDASPAFSAATFSAAAFSAAAFSSKNHGFVWEWFPKFEIIGFPANHI